MVHDQETIRARFLQGMLIAVCGDFDAALPLLEPAFIDLSKNDKLDDAQMTQLAFLAWVDYECSNRTSIKLSTAAFVSLPNAITPRYSSSPTKRSRSPPASTGTSKKWGQMMNFEQLVSLCHDTHQQLVAAASRSIDTHLVARNFLFGLYIVHFEQEGADRARYGKQTLKALSEAMKSAAGRGFSVDNLELMRRFYLHFRSDILRAPISEKPSRQSLPDASRKSETLSRNLHECQGFSLPSREMVGDLPRRFNLGWSHDVELLTIDDSAERSFYEIEAAANQWSVRELQRQIASSLYQRLSLSRDKQEIRRLATEGLIVEKAADLIKNPLVLEFLGLEDRPHYSEDELESAIIDQIYLPSKEELKARLESIASSLEGGHS